MGPCSRQVMVCIGNCLKQNKRQAFDGTNGDQFRNTDIQYNVLYVL